jgi:hypothetical protein
LARRPARTIAHPFPAPIIRGSLREEEEKEFARHTPPEVANWLRRQLAAIPGHPVLQALAVDDRMSDLWTMLRSWEPKVSLVQLAVHFSTPTILSALERPLPERYALAWSEYSLGSAAREFALSIELWRNTATELWGEPVEVLVERLHSFADAAWKRGEAKEAIYEYIPEPSRRGRGVQERRHGVQEQRAFRESLSRALERICDEYPLSKRKQDLIIATITSVISPSWEVDVETVSRQRKRRRNRPLSDKPMTKHEGDKSH